MTEGHMDTLTPEELAILGGTFKKPVGPPAIIVRNVVKYYKRYGMNSRGKLALNNLSLEVNQGDSVALLGPNGAGKTTLLRILFGLILPTSGEVTIFDSGCEDACWKAKSGYVPEIYTPARFLTGLELLKMAARSRGMDMKNFDSRVDWLDEKLGVKDMLPVKIKEFSRGMLQQFAIIESLIHDPDLIVMDEPASSLDALHRRKLRGLLRELCQKGKTIIISSHILSEVEEVCDRAVFLDKGRLVQQGKIKDLIATEEGYLITFKTPNTIPEELPRLGVLTADAVMGTTTLETRSESEKDAAVKALANNFISIDCISAKQKTLEEVFLSLMEEKVLEKMVSELMLKNE